MLPSSSTRAPTQQLMPTSRLVAASRNRYAYLGNANVKDGFGRGHHVEPVEPDFTDFLRMHQFDDELEILLLLHCSFAEQIADIENTQAAHFQKVTDHWWAIAFQRVGRDMLEFDHVVGDQTMSARDEFQRKFAFANPGIALDEHAGSEHFEKNTMDRGDLGQTLRQIMPQIGHQDRACQGRREQGGFGAFGAVPQNRRHGFAIGNDDGCELGGKQVIDGILQTGIG